MYFLDHNGQVPVSVSDVSLCLKRFAGTSKVLLGCFVVGSCNGLVCFGLMLNSAHPEPQNKFEAIVLWNPETGQGRDLLVPPLPLSFYSSRTGGDLPAYGFGFDEHNDDYKVVRILPVKPDVLSYDIFSRNSGRWKKLDKSLPGYRVSEGSAHSVMLNGCLYWLVLALGGEGDDEKLGCVLSFDLRHDEFRIVTVLKDAIVHNDSAVRLIKWKENCLALLHPPRVNQHVRGHDFALRLILDGDSNVIVGRDGERQTTTLRNPDCFYREFYGVSRERFFVTELEKGLSSHIGNLVTYDDPFSLDHKDACGQQISGVWGLSSYCEAHDYVPSLVSVYPDEKTMIEEQKKMELRYWVDLFWRDIDCTYI